MDFNNRPPNKDLIMSGDILRRCGPSEIHQARRRGRIVGSGLIERAAEALSAEDEGLAFKHRNARLRQAIQKGRLGFILGVRLCDSGAPLTAAGLELGAGLRAG